jgi:invasion protein IalB
VVIDTDERMSMLRLPTGLILATILGSALAAGDVAAEGATVAGVFGGWSLYTTEAGATRLCFIAAPPAERKPPNANRATTLFYVSAWPKDGIRSEVSVKLGYPIKPASEVTVAVGKDTFKLFPKDERAFVADATEELKLIEALKKGSEAAVSATSARGTATTDTYSLTGVKQALQALATACP